MLSVHSRQYSATPPRFTLNWWSSFCRCERAAMVQKSFWITKSLTLSAARKHTATRIRNLLLTVTAQDPMTIGWGTHVKTHQKTELVVMRKISGQIHCPSYPDTAELFCLDHWTPLMEQPSIYSGENHILKNRVGAAWAWLLSKMNIFSSQKCKFMRQEPSKI